MLSFCFLSVYISTVSSLDSDQDLLKVLTTKYGDFWAAIFIAFYIKLSQK